MEELKLLAELRAIEFGARMRAGIGVCRVLGLGGGGGVQM